MGRTKDSWYLRNKRVRKCLKTFRREYEELVARVSEQRTEQDGEEDRKDRWRLGADLYPNVTSKGNTDVVILSIVNYMIHHSNGGLFECGLPFASLRKGL